MKSRRSFPLFAMAVALFIVIGFGIVVIHRAQGDSGPQPNGTGAQPASPASTERGGSKSDGSVSDSAPATEEYRILKKDDGIKFAIRGEMYYANLPGQPAKVYTIGAFVLTDSAGKEFALDLTDNNYSSDSMFIQTTLFGPIKVISDQDDTYAATDTQIKKIHDFLAAQDKGSSATRPGTATDIWTDPTTGLMWTMKDNGSDVTQAKAADYCKSLSVSGFHDWRLPTIDELSAIYDGKLGGAEPALSSLFDQGHFKGGITALRFEWSSSKGTDQSALYFDFETGNRSSGLDTCRVLAVRNAGK